MPRDRFYGLDNEERIAILEGRAEDVRPENLELAEKWLAELKESQSQETNSEVEDGED